SPRARSMCICVRAGSPSVHTCSAGWTPRMRQCRSGMQGESPPTDVQDILHVREDRTKCLLSRMYVVHAREGEEEKPCTRTQIDEAFTRLGTEVNVRKAPELCRRHDGRLHS